MQKNIFVSSFNSLKSVKGLAITAMLISLSCVLSFAKFAITPNINVTLYFLPISVGALILGPVPAAIIGAVADLLGCFITPTGPYFPGFTINAFIIGIIYGIFYFSKKPKVWKIIAARLVIMVIIDLALTPLWLHILYSTPLVWAFWVERFIKCAVVVPIEVAFMSMVNTAVFKIFNKN